MDKMQKVILVLGELENLYYHMAISFEKDNEKEISERYITRMCEIRTIKYLLTHHKILESYLKTLKIEGVED